MSVNLRLHESRVLLAGLLGLYLAAAAGGVMALLWLQDGDDGRLGLFLSAGLTLTGVGYAVETATRFVRSPIHVTDRGIEGRRVGGNSLNLPWDEIAGASFRTRLGVVVVTVDADESVQSPRAIYLGRPQALKLADVFKAHGLQTKTL